MSNIDGVSSRGGSESQETGISRLKLIIAVPSAINVHRTSRVTLILQLSNTSRIRCAVPIMTSTLFPMLDALGRLKTLVHFLLKRCFATRSSLESCKRKEVPMKFIWHSDLNCLTGPLIEKNLQNAMIQLEALADFRQSCKQHLLVSTQSSLVQCITTSHGPTTSSPTKVNGGSCCRHSSESSATCCCFNFNF